MSGIEKEPVADGCTGARRYRFLDIISSYLQSVAMHGYDADGRRLGKLGCIDLLGKGWTPAEPFQSGEFTLRRNRSGYKGGIVSHHYPRATLRPRCVTILVINEPTSVDIAQSLFSGRAYRRLRRQPMCQGILSLGTGHWVRSECPLIHIGGSPGCHLLDDR